MSHFTTIETRVRDLDALREACEDLGLQLMTGVPCRGYAGATRKAEHVIRLKGPYDIAVDPGPDNGFALTCDWWDGHVAKETGPDHGRLLQAYGVRKTLREAKARGLRVNRKLETDGSILLVLEGGAL